MPQRIEFEGAIHEFPDDFSDADIAAALGETGPAQSARRRGRAWCGARATAAPTAGGRAGTPAGHGWPARGARAIWRRSASIS